MAEITAAEIASIVYPGLELNDTITVDTLKEELGKRYKSIELAEKEKIAAEGSAFGIAQTKMKQVLADMGISADEYKDLKKVDEFAALASNKVKGIFDELNALKEASKGTGKDAEKITEYLNKVKGLEELLNKANSEKEEAIKSIDQLKTAGEEKFNSLLLNHEVNRLYSEANWTDDSDKVVKEGVWAVMINGKYQFKREGDKVLVYDSEGKIVPDGTNQMTAEKLFELKLKEAKRFKENAGNAGAGSGAANTTGTGDGTGKTKQQLEYEAKMLGKLKV